MVAVMRPPMTTVARGRCTSAPLVVESAIGMKPRAATVAVMSTGRSLDSPAFSMMRSSGSPIVDWRRLLTELIRTIPFRTETPNKAMNPMPAEILKGMSLSHSAAMPPMAASGTPVKIISACPIWPKARYNSRRISANAAGTATNRRDLARSRFSKVPP